MSATRTLLACLLLPALATAADEAVEVEVETTPAPAARPAAPVVAPAVVPETPTTPRPASRRGDPVPTPAEPPQAEPAPVEPQPPTPPKASPFGPPPGPEDVIILANKRRLNAVLADGQDPASASVAVRTRAGIMVLDRAMIVAIERSFESRRAALAPDDYAGHLELARWALGKGRKSDALDLLAGFADKPALDLEGLRLLATLADELNNGQESGIARVLALYRRYRDAGGKDQALLDRLASLEKLIADHTRLVEEAATKRAENRAEDGHEADAGWTGEDPQFANVAKATVVDAPGGIADKVLQVDLEAGKNYKGAVKRRLQMDITGSHLLSMQVFNAGAQATRLSVAVKAGEKWEYFESRPFDVPSDKAWHVVTFDLLGADFKSAASKWAHNVPISRPNDIHELQIQIHNDTSPRTVYLNAIGFAGKPAAGAKPPAETPPADGASRRRGGG